jgi:hypothetical protein
MPRQSNNAPLDYSKELARRVKENLRREYGTGDPTPQEQAGIDSVLEVLSAANQRMGELARRLPNWREGASPIAVLAGFLKCECGFSLKEIAGLTDHQMILFIEEKLRLSGAAPKPEQDGTVAGTKQWPLGMKAGLANRKVCRNHVVVDLGAHKALWDVLCTLVRNYPGRTPATALQSEAVDLGAVYNNISKLKLHLRRLGITLSTARGLGYLLAESNANLTRN